jgi:hypothetical protein
MAKKITNEDIKKINEIYIKVKSYAETARQTGFSVSTVKKYIIIDYKPENEIETQKFDLKSLPEFSLEEFEKVEDWGKLCVLTENEKEEIKQLWGELRI